MKGQVSLMDGITFLLIAAVSSALVFTFVGTYGENEQRVISSAHVLNYMQSVTKTMYYVDASTLNKITAEGIPVYEKNLGGPTGQEIWPAIDDPTYGCPFLSNFPGSVSVTDLLKRDLADGGVTGTEVVTLDDYFGEKPVGNEVKGVKVMGRTAMRCAMKELMKPFSFSGFDYFVEVVNPQLSGSNGNGQPIPISGARITNSLDGAVIFDAGPEPERFVSSGCENAQRVTGEILSVTAPFRVLATDTDGGQLTSEVKDYVIRICVWKPTT